MFKKKIDRSYKDEVEPQDIFLDTLSRKKEEEMGISEQKMEVPLRRFVLSSFAFLLFFAIFLLLGKSFHMQVIDGETYQSFAKRNMSAIMPARVLRGIIYDLNGDQLVKNSVTFDLFIDKRKIKDDKDYLLNNLSEILGIDKDDLEERLGNINESGKIASDISHEASVILTIRENDFPGINVERITERNYPHHLYLSHILGYTGEVTREDISKNPERYTIHDYIGKAGLERFYEETLAKERGSFKIERDAFGKIIKKEEIDPILPGNNISLWIDLELQKKIVEVSNDVLSDIGSSKASIIAMNPQNGAILAMVSMPSYDNNVFSRTGDKNLLSQFLTDNDGVFLNRAIEALYPTGSTIKPLLAAAALEEGIISPTKKIYSPGYLDIPNPWNPTNPTRMLDFQAHGWTDVKEAIAVSSNVYFYTIGGGGEGQEGLGIKRIKEYLNLFSWGEQTGIDLPNEKRGVVPDPEWKTENIDLIWTLGDTYNTSIGQGYLTATPLQVAVSYSALVNGGKIFRPQIVKSIHEENEIIYDFEPDLIREGFISENNLNIVKEGMHMTTIRGTAQRLSLLSEKVGAKTGTAQIPKQGHYHNWVAVFGPYENPEIVLIVLIEEVQGIRASSSLIAYQVLDWYFSDVRE